MSHVIVLAARTSEGNAYVREHRDELPRGGRCVVPTSAAQIMGVVPHLVIELPGFAQRPDRHAILAAVKRSSKKYQDCEWRVIGAPVDFGRELWIPQSKPQWQRDLDAVIEPEGWEPPATLDARQTLELAAAPDETGAAVLSRVDQMRAMADELEDEPIVDPFAAPARAKGARRPRCKDCGALHWPEDLCSAKIPSSTSSDSDPFDNLEDE